MQQEPDGEALGLVYPKEDEEAGDEHRDDNRDDADRRRDEMRHAVLEPCDDHAEARQEERQDKEPQRNRVDREGEGDQDYLNRNAGIKKPKTPLDYPLVVDTTMAAC